MAKVGRPLTNLNDLPENWKETMLELASNGASDVRLRVKMDLTHNCWYSLLENEPEFSETVKQCRALAEDWWQAQGERGLFYTNDGEKINAKIYELNMMNRFGWNKKESQEVTGKDGQPLIPTVITIKVGNGNNTTDIKS